MLNKIKGLLLNFQNQQLENQYQLEKSIEIQRPVYLTLLAFGIILNSSVLFIHFFSQVTATWFINAAGLIFQVLQVIIVVICKQWQFQQLALTMTNIVIGCFQLNVDPQSTTNQEFFGYGCVFTQLQCVVYFASNFSHALFQITSLYILRITIITYFTQRLDFLSIFVGLFGSILMLISIYVKDRKSRRYFIQNIKEHHQNQISSFLINKPYIKIQYFENQLNFKLLSHFLIELFPSYDSNLCNSCNTRKLLREYYANNQIINLETQLIKRDFNALNGIIITVRNKRFKFNLRICELDPQFQQYIIIFQKLQFQVEEQVKMEDQQLKLRQFFKNSKVQMHQRVFSFGVYNILLLNSKFLSQINLVTTLQKAINFYKKHFYHNLRIDVVNKNANSHLYTFSNQLKIFLFQIVGIIGFINEKSKSRVYIIMENRSNKLYITFQGINNYELFSQVCQNYLILAVLDLIIQEKCLLTQKQEFCLKNYSKDSFYYDQKGVL